MRPFDRSFAYVGLFLALAGLWLMKDEQTRLDGGILALLGAVWAVMAWVRSSPRYDRWAQTNTGRSAKRLARGVSAVLSTLLAGFGVWLLLADGDAARWGGVAAILIGASYAAVEWAAALRPAPPPLQPLDDGLVIQPAGRFHDLLEGFSLLGRTAGFALASYVSLQLPKTHFTDWMFVIFATVFALFYALGTVARLPGALGGRRGAVRLDGAGVGFAGAVRPIPWSEVAAAELSVGDVVVKRRPDATSASGRADPTETRMSHGRSLSDEEERVVRSVIERNVPAA